MPVYNGLCHAPHVYAGGDIDWIINGSMSRCRHSHRVVLPLFSPETGKPFPAQHGGHLFEQICTEILTGTIYLDNLTAGIVSSISNSGKIECQVHLFRTSLISQGFISAIEADSSQVTTSRYDFIDWSLQEYGTRIPRSPKQSKLAIVGMACRLPGGANDPELFWELMVEGRDVHTQVPPDRFDLSTHYDPTGKTDNATETPFGNFIDNPGMFDAGFFNMSPREVSQDGGCKVSG